MFKITSLHNPDDFLTNITAIKYSWSQEFNSNISFTVVRFFIMNCFLRFDFNCLEVLLVISRLKFILNLNDVEELFISCEQLIISKKKEGARLIAEIIEAHFYIFMLPTILEIMANSLQYFSTFLIVIAFHWNCQLDRNIQ